MRGVRADAKTERGHFEPSRPALRFARIRRSNRPQRRKPAWVKSLLVSRFVGVMVAGHRLPPLRASGGRAVGSPPGQDPEIEAAHRHGQQGEGEEGQAARPSLDQPRRGPEAGIAIKRGCAPVSTGLE